MRKLREHLGLSGVAQGPTGAAAHAGQAERDRSWSAEEARLRPLLGNVSSFVEEAKVALDGGAPQTKVSDLVRDLDVSDAADLDGLRDFWKWLGEKEYNTVHSTVEQYIRGSARDLSITIEMPPPKKEQKRSTFWGPWMGR